MSAIVTLAALRLMTGSFTSANPDSHFPLLNFHKK